MRPVRTYKSPQQRVVQKGGIGVDDILPERAPPRWRIERPQKRPATLSIVITIRAERTPMKVLSALLEEVEEEGEEEEEDER